MHHEILAVSHQSCHMRPQGFRFTAGDDPSAALNNWDRSHSPRVEYKWHGENPVLSQTLLLWHHRASQVASHTLAEVAPVLRCLKGRFPRSIVFDNNGGCLGVDLIKRRPVRIQHSK